MTTEYTQEEVLEATRAWITILDLGGYISVVPSMYDPSSLTVAWQNASGLHCENDIAFTIEGKELPPKGATGFIVLVHAIQSLYMETSSPHICNISRELSHKTAHDAASLTAASSKIKGLLECSEIQLTK